MTRRAIAAILGLCPLLILAALGARPFVSSASPLPPAPTSAALPPPPVEGAASCPVTQPNGDWPPNPESVAGGTGPGGYGNDALWTNLWMWDDAGRIPVPSSHVLPDGSFGPMKWAWYRYVPGRLTVEGRRLDAAAPPLRFEHPGDYGTRGFQPVGLIFPTAGCWEVTGRVGDASLTFVTLVIPPPG